MEKAMAFTLKVVLISTAHGLGRSNDALAFEDKEKFFVKCHIKQCSLTIFGRTICLFLRTWAVYSDASSNFHRHIYV